MSPPLSNNQSAYPVRTCSTASHYTRGNQRFSTDRGEEFWQFSANARIASPILSFRKSFGKQRSLNGILIDGAI